MSKKFFVAGIVLYPDIYPCFDTFVLPKEVKKSSKKFGGKEKSSTFAIPFGKRVGESDSGSGFPGGDQEIIDKTGDAVQKYSSKQN